MSCASTPVRPLWLARTRRWLARRSSPCPPKRPRPPPSIWASAWSHCSNSRVCRATSIIAGPDRKTSLDWPMRPRANGRPNSTHDRSPLPTSKIFTLRPSRPLEAPVNKSLLLYPLILIVFALGMFVAVKQGSTLDASRITNHESRIKPPSMQPSSGLGPSASLLANLRQNFEDPLTRLFVQLILIVLAARVCGSLMRKAGQPAVIGEMIAGILLGSSLMGWLWPGFFQMVFRSEERRVGKERRC